MAIQYYMRGYDAILDIDVDWVVNDTPDTSGAYSGSINLLTNIRVNRTVQSPVDSLIKPSIPLFVSNQIPNINQNFLYLNSYDWLYPGTPSTPIANTGIIIMRGADVSPPNPNDYAGLYWDESNSQWTFNILNSGTFNPTGSVSLAVGSPTPTTGIIRIPNNQFINSLDSTSTDTSLIGVNSNDKIEIGDTTHLTYIASRLEVNDGSGDPVAGAGLIRLPNTVEATIAVRNSGDSSDLLIVSVDTDDIVIGDNTNNTNIKYNVGDSSGAHIFNINGSEIFYIDNVSNAKIIFNESVTSPTIKQKETTVASTTGESLSISAQDSTGSGLCYGGDLYLSSGVGISGDGVTYLQAGGANRLQIRPDSVQLNVYRFNFDENVSSPEIGQNQINVPSVGAEDLIIFAQSNSEVSSTGAGSLYLTSGSSGSGNHGDVVLQVGGNDRLTISLNGSNFELPNFCNFYINSQLTAQVVTDKFITNKGRRRQVDSVDAVSASITPFTIPDGYDVVSIENLTGTTLTIYLPLSPVKGDTFTIKDTNGDATLNPFTISGNGYNIDGSATTSITNNYQSLDLIFTGSKWSII